jgi:hypothetical protein
MQRRASIWQMTACAWRRRWLERLSCCRVASLPGAARWVLYRMLLLWIRLDCSLVSRRSPNHGPLPWQGPAQLCRLLAALGCHDSPAWRSACPLHGGGSSSSSSSRAPATASAATTAAAAAASRSEWEAAWCLESDTGGSPPWRHRGGGGCADAVTDWRSYYSSANLSAASPAALLAHHPLTLWYSLTHVLPAHGRPLPAPGSGQLVVHWLGESIVQPAMATANDHICQHTDHPSLSMYKTAGPREELAMLPCFMELALLLPPGTDLRLDLVGPEVPHQRHGARQTWGELPGRSSLTVALWHGRYDQVLDGWRGREASSDVDTGAPNGESSSMSDPSPRPHLVFAPNAGLPAMPSWLPSLRRLLEADGGTPAGGSGAGDVGGRSSGKARGRECMPFLATDYCEEAVFQSLRLLRSLVGTEQDGFSRILVGGDGVGGVLNPFRRPLPTFSHGTALPACSNALLFGWM